MKIKRLWIEFETDRGETLLRPATDDDLDYLKYKPNPEHLRKPTAETEVQDLGFQTWEPQPYSREEIEALRSTPGELREAVTK